MTSFEQDIKFLKEALPQLQDYLLSNELYWPIGSSLPRMTPGALLLALRRLDAVQPVEAKKYRSQFETVRGKWRAAWDSKATREVANRLRLWSQFLSDNSESPRREVDSYPAEVRGRAMLQLLLLELPNAPEKKTLSELESSLKSRLVASEFQWETGLQGVFPRTDFWFLYGRL